MTASPYAILCPSCDLVAFVPDDSSPLGFRRKDTAGCVRIDGCFVVLICCHCGHEWRFALLVKEFQRHIAAIERSL